MNSDFATGQKSDEENGQDPSPPRGVGGSISQGADKQPLDKEKKNKNRFIKLLKEYIEDRKGTIIYDQIYGQLQHTLNFRRKEYEDEMVFSGYKK